MAHAPRVIKRSAETVSPLRLAIKKIEETSKATNRHVSYLQAFAEHGKTASFLETLDLMQRLLVCRQDARRSVTELRRWNEQCVQHEGFALVKQRIFEHNLKDLQITVLSNLYNKLQRLNFQEEAAKVWPFVQQQIEANNMKQSKELVGIWTVAPQEHLAQLDAVLARAVIDAATTDALNLMNTISRALTDFPTSKAAQKAAIVLGKGLKDLSSEDLVAVVSRLGTRTELTKTTPLTSELKRILRQAKTELVKRDGELPTSALCSMIGACSSCEEALWGLIQKQLMERSDFEVHQILALLTFLRIHGKNEANKFKGMLIDLLPKVIRVRSDANLTNLVRELVQHLHMLVGNQSVCQELLNAALRLNENLHPAVNWQLFIHAGEAQLVKHHSYLKARVQQIGLKILEKHGIGRREMSLDQMISAARAMRSNEVKLEHCAKQMAQRFAAVFQAGEEAAIRKLDASSEVQDASEGREAVLEGATPSQSSSAPVEQDASKGREAVLEGATPSQSSSAPIQQDVTKSDPSKPSSEADNKPTATDELFSEVQWKLVSFWTLMNSLDLEEASLTAAANRICTAKQTLFEAVRLAELSSDLATLAKGDEAVKLQEGLESQLEVHLPQLTLDDLFKVTEFPASARVQRALAKEVAHRLTGSASADSAGRFSLAQDDQQFDKMVHLLSKMATWHGADAEVLETSSLGLADVISRSLLTMLEKASPATSAYQTLIAAVKACSQWSVAEDARTTLLQPLRHGLHVAAENSPGPLTLEDATELAFSMSVLRGGNLPFDVVARLWHVAASAVSNREASSSLSPEHTAKLMAFSLAAKQLSSPTVLAALRLAPGAHSLESFISSSKNQKAAHMKLSQDFGSSSSSFVKELGGILPVALPSELSVANFMVPDTPYVVDFALEGTRTLIVVPRREHRAAGRSTHLNGQAELMERSLKALGWHTCWIWPEEWSDKLEKPAENAEAIRRFLLNEEPFEQSPESSTDS